MLKQNNVETKKLSLKKRNLSTKMASLTMSSMASLTAVTRRTATRGIMVVKGVKDEITGIN